MTSSSSTSRSLGSCDSVTFDLLGLEKCDTNVQIVAQHQVRSSLLLPRLFGHALSVCRLIGCVFVHQVRLVVVQI